VRAIRPCALVSRWVSSGARVSVALKESRTVVGGRLLAVDASRHGGLGNLALAPDDGSAPWLIVRGSSVVWIRLAEGGGPCRA